jgi:hypothetical protein
VPAVLVARGGGSPGLPAHHLTVIGADSDGSVRADGAAEYRVAGVAKGASSSGARVEQSDYTRPGGGQDDRPIVLHGQDRDATAEIGGPQPVTADDVPSVAGPIVTGGYGQAVSDHHAGRSVVVRQLVPAARLVVDVPHLQHAGLVDHEQGAQVRGGCTEACPIPKFVVLPRLPARSCLFKAQPGRHSKTGAAITHVHVFKNGTNLRQSGLLQDDNIIAVINADTYPALHQCVGDKVTEGDDTNIWWVKIDTGNHQGWVSAVRIKEGKNSKPVPDVDTQPVEWA